MHVKVSVGIQFNRDEIGKNGKKDRNYTQKKGIIHKTGKNNYVSML